MSGSQDPEVTQLEQFVRLSQPVELNPAFDSETIKDNRSTKHKQNTFFDSFLGSENIQRPRFPPADASLRLIVHESFPMDIRTDTEPYYVGSI